ncbi:MAG: STAS domain-containing protein [Bacteroidales bacterium]|nr:STAS domain-containing protein [Bacteroidales bacterium]
MKIILDNKNRVATPVGRLDALSSNDFEVAMQSLLTSGNSLVVDLSQCTYLSSAGIRVLLKTKKSLVAKKGDVILCSMLPEVFQVIEMAGLHRVFRTAESLKAALIAIRAMEDKTNETIAFEADKIKYVFKVSDSGGQTARIWHDDGIVSYNELGFSVGFGSPAEVGSEAGLVSGLFVTAGHCAGFIPDNIHQEADFRVSNDTTRAGIQLEQAISFSEQFSGFMQLSESGNISLHQLARASEAIKLKLENRPELMLMAIFNPSPAAPTFTVALLADNSFREYVTKDNLQRFQQWLPDEKHPLIGASFGLAEPGNHKPDDTLEQFVSNVLSIENIVEIRSINMEEIIEDPQIWVFYSNDLKNAASGRLQIETAPGMIFEPHKEFLTRRLYLDSSKIVIRQLHGGYSAQTYEVASFDAEGRKMRPTVLKIANRAMIERESDRCKQYAMPYILNNSAMVLGTEYYGETGALRYNFVGIGGESSQLKWLTHHYQQSDMAVLEPLFDKIFLQILKPWYGQAVKKTIFPYKDHDPTFTFFPHIFETVNELFSISADEQYIGIKEAEKPVLNPYWFLNHEYSRRREEGMEYLTGICHGDLNMQNILLDESMNVYLIDFSETKPRSLISDFARLEAIFLVDNATLDNEDDMNHYLHFIRAFYSTDQLNAIPEITYTGRHKESVFKNVDLTLKMRAYAFSCTNNNPDPTPYYFALLEWILPIVCYFSKPIAHKRLSMIVSSMLCEKVMKRE